MGNATDKQGGPFIYAEGQNDAGQPDGTVSVSAHFISRAESAIEDLIHNAELQHRATCWHKGMNSDLVDSKHASYLTDAVNEDDVDHPDLNDSSPVAPSGGLNVKWQVATAQNTDSQTPVSAYVPFSSISTATAVSTDYVVITDTSDGNNPKRALVSDIATATLSGIGSGTPVAADTFVFVDADDGVAKKGSAANTLVALGGAPSATAVTAASVLADNEVPKIDGASRAVQASSLYMDDVAFGVLVQRTADISSAGASDALSLRSGNNTGAGNTGDIALRSGAASTGTSGDAILDAGPGTATNGTAKVGATNADAVSIGRSGKNSQVNGTLGVTEAVTCSSTLASGAHTITHAATASITAASTPMLDLNSALSGSNVRRRVFPVRASIAAGTTLVSWAVGAGENYRFRVKCLVKRTDSGNQSAWVDYGFVVQDIGGAITVTTEANSSIDGVLAATAPAGATTKGGTPFLITIAPTAGTEVWNGHVEVLGSLNT